MKQTNPKISQLNQLLVINMNAENAYLEALEVIESEELQKFFRARAYERGECCRYLAAEIQLLGGKPNYYEMEDPKININWPDFKKVIASNNTRALFNEISRIKSICLTQYNTVLNNYDFPEGLVKILKKQRKIIGSSIGLIRYKDGYSQQRPLLPNT